jgi:hypothetical protein
MKLYISSVVNEDPSNPISIPVFKFGYNKEGYFSITFDTKNHKYLNIDADARTTVRYTEDNLRFCSIILTLESQEKYYEFKGFKSLWQEIRWLFKYPSLGQWKNVLFPFYDFSKNRVEIHIEPENEAERDSLDGKLSVLALRWEYGLVFIPYDRYNIVGNVNEFNFWHEIYANIKYP